MKSTRIWLVFSLAIFVSAPTIVMAQGVNVALNKSVKLTTNGADDNREGNSLGITDGSLDRGRPNGVIG